MIQGEKMVVLIYLSGEQKLGQLAEDWVIFQ